MKTDTGMNLPICGHCYSIRIVDKFEGEGNPAISGRVNHETHEIELSSKLVKTQMEEVLLHEVGHCFFYHHGHENDGRLQARIQRENILDLFANGYGSLGAGEFLLKKAKKGRKHG